MATRILVTGGTGNLGRILVRKLSAQADTIVRVMSRSPAGEVGPGIEWAQADLETGEGVAAAVAGVQTILHAASSPGRRSRQADVEGTRYLLELARPARVEHIVYISIVGVDRVPYSYYRHKYAAEQIIESGSVPWTILRATQFHDLLDFALSALAELPVLPAPTDLVFQPVDVEEVAEALVQYALSAPSGRVPDMGGPEVLDGYGILYPWLKASQTDLPVVHLRLPGATLAAFRKGEHTCPQNRQGKTTWQEWLMKKYGS